VNNAGNALFLMRKSRGTDAIPLSVIQNDNVGMVRMEAYDGTTYRETGWVRSMVDGPVSTGIVPGAMLFATSDNTGVNAERMRISSTGNVGIGTTVPNSRLAVNGIISCKEVQVTLTGWADFVFDDGYRLKPLDEIESYIMTNRHLPGVPTTKEVTEKGVKLGEMDAILLQKIEELTLHMIDLNNQVAQQGQEIKSLMDENKSLKKKIND
jgi:hypothetical protein